MFRRKIDFRKHPLEICGIAVITGRTVVESGNSYSDWKWKYKIEYSEIGNAILTNWDSYFWYDPQKGSKKLYPYGHGNGVMGTIFVLKRANCTIENDSRVKLTKKERKTGKISFKRIQEITDTLN